MFPKAHAAAYVMMAWRIAYCKVNYPLAYYAAYFSIRASAFSYEIMCQGQQHLEAVMADYKKLSLIHILPVRGTGSRATVSAAERNWELFDGPGGKGQYDSGTDRI